MILILRFLSMELKKGDTWCQLREVKRFHFFTFVGDYKGRALLFDSHDRKIFLVSYREIECALNSSAHHPFHNELRMFDFIETLPDFVMECINAEVEDLLKEGEPEELTLFKICERN